VIITLVSKRVEYNREIKKLIMEISLAEWKERTHLALKLPGTIWRIYPVIQTVLSNSSLIRLIGKDKDINIDEVKRILEKNKQIRKLIEEYSVNVHKDDPSIKNKIDA
jgi:hypothetical protein